MALGFSPQAYVPSKTRANPKKGFRVWTKGLLGVFFVAGILSGLYFDWRYRSSLKELSSLRARNAETLRKIESLKENPGLYEEIARKKYGYIKKGERLIVFEKKSPEKRR